MIDIILKAEGSQGKGKTQILNLVQDFFRSKGLIAEYKGEHELLINGELNKPSGQLTINFEKEMKR